MSNGRARGVVLGGGPGGGAAWARTRRGAPGPCGHRRCPVRGGRAGVAVSTPVGAGQHAPGRQDCDDGGHAAGRLPDQTVAGGRRPGGRTPERQRVTVTPAARRVCAGLVWGRLHAVPRAAPGRAGPQGFEPRAPGPPSVPGKVAEVRRRWSAAVPHRLGRVLVLVLEVNGIDKAQVEVIRVGRGLGIRVPGPAAWRPEAPGAVRLGLPASCHPPDLDLTFLL